MVFTMHIANYSLNTLINNSDDKILNNKLINTRRQAYVDTKDDYNNIVTAM